MKRPPESETTRVTITLPTTLVRKLDEHLSQGESNRTATIRRLIESAVLDVEQREEREREKQVEREQYIRAWRDQPDTEEEFGWTTRPGSPGASRRDPLGTERGAVWWADLPAPWGRRPVLLIARNEAYHTLTRFAVAPLTTRIRRIPTSVLLTPAHDSVTEQCVVSLDHIQVIEHDWLVEPIGRLSEERMAAVDRALHLALGIETCPTR